MTMDGILEKLANTDRSVLSVAGIILAVALFLSVNLFSALVLGSQRTDLTDNKLFTLSDSTRAVVEALNEPVTMRLYQSRELLDAAPPLKVYSERVNELLRTYSEMSNGMIRLEIVNALPFSSEEDRAIAFQLEGFQLSATGERGYFGLVATNSTDDVEVRAFLSPDREQFLEYDLTRIINNLANPRKPVVAVIDGLGVMERVEERIPSVALIRQMQQVFNVRGLVYDAEEIPPNVDVLMVVHPANLPEKAQYAIDQYVLGGGPAIFFLDPFAESSAKNPQNNVQYLFPASDLNALLAAWGVDQVDDRIVGDREMAIRITGFAGPNRVVTDYVPWLQIRPESFNEDDVVTGTLQLMRMSSAGGLREIGLEGVTVTPLIQTSRDSMMMDTITVRRRGDPKDLLDIFEPEGVRQTIAARITGMVNTAFPDGKPPDPNDFGPAPGEEAPPEEEEVPQLMSSVQPINVIIVTDADMLMDSHTVTAAGAPSSSNADFVTNAVENLAGRGALIGLRGRGLSHRPFTTVEQIEDDARGRYFQTEQQLKVDLEETQDRIAELQAQGRAGGDFQLLTQEDQETILEFNRRMLTIRQELRDVRRALNEDINTLETRLELGNIAAIPLIVIVLGILIALWRRAALRRGRNSA
jgi:ABC-type uncharacterized transport system involved in gliding motility auxiliary subunit